jgi:hypothetical protein
MVIFVTHVTTAAADGTYAALPACCGLVLGMDVKVQDRVPPMD